MVGGELSATIIGQYAGSLGFHKYLLAPVDNSSAVSVLGWWRDNESVYSTTVVVARGFLGVPATSLQLERIF